MSVSPLMRELSGYIAGAVDQPLPPDVVEAAKHHILDTLAAMVSGSRLVPGTRALSYVRAQGGTPQATVAGSDIVTSAVNAALANGMLAHADETDDSHAPSRTHPGCAVVPAALAMGELYASGGQSLIRSVALGYDIGCRLMLALHAYDFRQAGHSTHTFGPMFGAAVAAAALAGLDETRVRHVLSYTAQQASGVASWMRDSEHVEKAFDFGGMPARNGVAAATMVAHGFTGVDDVFSGTNDFFYAYDESSRVGPPPEPGLLVAELGRRYEIRATNIKRWTVGSPIQAPLDALQHLVSTHVLTADRVRRVRVRISHQGAGTVDDRDMPDICLQYLCAVMLLDGTVTFAAAHDSARMNDPAVLELRRRIELSGDDELSAALPARHGIVEIDLDDGTSVSHKVTAVRGTAQNPMTRDEVEAKCVDLVVPVVGAANARRLVDAVWALEKLDDVRDLATLLRV